MASPVPISSDVDFLFFEFWPGLSLPPSFSTLDVLVCAIESGDRRTTFFCAHHEPVNPVKRDPRSDMGISRSKLVSQSSRTSSNSNVSDSVDVSFDDFQILRAIGKGSFGKVSCMAMR